MHEVLHVLKHTAVDTLKLLPVLFLTYLLMEFLEQKAADKAKNITAKAGAFGPAIGGLLGAIPQCGFSASASNLYAGGVITVGTLIAIFVSTSDEMLPLMIAKEIEISRIAIFIGTKVVLGMLLGFLVDLIMRIFKKNKQEIKIHEICEQEHCHCEKGIFVSTCIHTAQIIFFIFLCSFAIHMLIEAVGQPVIAEFVAKTGIFAPLVCGLIGLIPNCAASVVLTKLFLEGIISTGSLMAGLIAGSGLGLLVLYRMNRNIKQNLAITGTVYGFGVLVGIVMDLLHIAI